MVSIFGLKIGGDKKKRFEQTNPRFVQSQDHKAHHDALGASNISPNKGGQGSHHAGSERSTPRPDNSQSNILTPTSHAFQAFYTPGSQPVATSSMQELVRTASSGDPGLPKLKSVASNPNMSTRWNTGSSPILTSSSDVTLRPSTSGGQKPRVNLQDIQFPTGQVAALAIKSPVSEAHHEHQDDNNDFVPATSQPHPVPKPLHINKQPAPAIPPRSARRHLPSPPPSVKTQSEKASSEFDRLSILEKPYVLVAAGEDRPSSRGSHRNIPTSLRELMAADDPMFITPTSVPTPPPSLPRASNENGNRASMNEWGEPVIQNVRAKRETMTISAANRQSLEKMIDNFDQASSFGQDQRPRTSSGPRTSRPKPPTLKLDTRMPDWNGPISAPFAARQRPESPFRPQRTGVPAAAVGARGRPKRPDTRGIRRPTADEYGIAPVRPVEGKSEHGSRQNTVDEYDVTPGRPFDEKSEYGSRQPTADVYEIHPERLFEEKAEYGSRQPIADVYEINPERPFEEQFEYESRLPAEDECDITPRRPFEGDSDDETPPSSPGSLDSPIMPVDGPLASPMVPPIRSPVGGPRRDGLDPNFRFPDWSMSEESRSGSVASVTRPHPLQDVSSAESASWPLPISSVVVPDVFSTESSSLPARAQSPFAIPSFSRPWTPTNVRPGTPVRTTELTIPSGLRGPSPSPRGPPPRRTPEYALKNPHVVQEHSEAGFI